MAVGDRRTDPKTNEPEIELADGSFNTDWGIFAKRVHLDLLPANTFSGGAQSLDMDITGNDAVFFEGYVTAGPLPDSNGVLTVPMFTGDDIIDRNFDFTILNLDPTNSFEVAFDPNWLDINRRLATPGISNVRLAPNTILRLRGMWRGTGSDNWLDVSATDSVQANDLTASFDWFGLRASLGQGLYTPHFYTNRGAGQITINVDPAQTTGFTRKGSFTELPIGDDPTLEAGEMAVIWYTPTNVFVTVLGGGDQTVQQVADYQLTNLPNGAHPTSASSPVFIPTPTGSALKDLTITFRDRRTEWDGDERTVPTEIFTLTELQTTKAGWASTDAGGYRRHTKTFFIDATSYDYSISYQDTTGGSTFLFEDFHSSEANSFGGYEDLVVTFEDVVVANQPLTRILITGTVGAGGGGTINVPLNNAGKTLIDVSVKLSNGTSFSPPLDTDDGTNRWWYDFDHTTGDINLSRFGAFAGGAYRVMAEYQ